MSTWSDLGFPCIHAEGYGYSFDLGIARPAVDSAIPDQKVGWETSLKTFTISCTVPPEMLSAMEAFFVTEAYDWFTMPLVSGDGEGAIDHIVRAVGPYSLVYQTPTAYKLQVQLETPITSRMFVTTRLYPVEAYEGMQVDGTRVEQFRLWALDRVEMDPTATVEAITVFQTLFESSHDQFIDDFMDAGGAIESATVFQTLFEEAHDQFAEDFMGSSGAVVSVSVAQTFFPVGHDQPPDDFMASSGAIESVTVFES